MRTNHQGMVTVEFVMVVGVFLLILIAIIEFGRVMFIFNALEEGTRRGVRLATVCPINDPRLAHVTIFDETGGSLIAKDLTTNNVAVLYLDQDGNQIQTPATPNNKVKIRYVRVRIDNYRPSAILIPYFNSLPYLNFESTLPRESLGYSPPQNGDVAC